MNRIAAVFQQYAAKNRIAIIPYITPEYPLKNVTVPLILALESAGAAMIEVGIPFSDPLADGPTIQHSSEIAINNGATLKRVLELVTEARTKTDIPIILMGYVNPVLNYEMERFCADAKNAGVDGLIIPDLPPEESAEFRTLCAKNGLSNIFLIAPTSTDDRIIFIDDCSTDLTYCVSVTGVTGARNAFGVNFDEFLGRVKKNVRKPFVVGFGIKSKEQIAQIAPFANGVVIGSALLQQIAEANTAEEVTILAHRFLSSLQ